MEEKRIEINCNGNSSTYEIRPGSDEKINGAHSLAVDFAEIKKNKPNICSFIYIFVWSFTFTNCLLLGYLLVMGKNSLNH